MPKKPELWIVIYPACAYPVIRRAIVVEAGSWGEAKLNCRLLLLRRGVQVKTTRMSARRVSKLKKNERLV